MNQKNFRNITLAALIGLSGVLAPEGLLAQNQRIDEAQAKRCMDIGHQAKNHKEAIQFFDDAATRTRTRMTDFWLNMRGNSTLPRERRLA